MTAKRSIVKWQPTGTTEAVTTFGISSHENDYRLSWCLNKELRLAFTQSDENFMTTDGKEFTCFVHTDEENTLTLISNQSENGAMLKKYKNLDFLLKFAPELTEDKKTEWLKELRSVSLISAVFVMPNIVEN